MKDVSHHLKHIQKKVLRETRKEQRLKEDSIANGNPNPTAESSVEMRKNGPSSLYSTKI